jgi:hypothetical protein
MIWGDRPPDATATQQLPKLDTTMAFPVVGDEDLADMGPTRILTDQPARHLAAHRKPPREVLTWRQTGLVAAALAVSTFGVVWMVSDHGSPAPATSHQAAPEAVTVLSPSPTKAKVKRTAEPPAEPVVLRSERPAPAPAAAPVVTITVTAKATPTPKPSTPSPTKSATLPPTPSGTPDVTVTPTVSEPTDTPATSEATETTDGDDS